MEEPNPRLTSGLPAAHPRIITRTTAALRSWLLTNVPMPFCLCKPFSCKACVGNNHLSALNKIGTNINIFVKMIEKFGKVAKEVVGQGGDVSCEWPTGCALWKNELLQILRNGLSLNKVINTHGCATRLRSSEGKTPFKNRLIVAGSSRAIFDMLNKF